MSKVMSKALIIIDLEKGFMNDLTKDLPGKIKKYLGENKDKFDLVLFTQFKNHKGSNFDRLMEYEDFMKPEEYDIVPELQEFVTKDNLFVKDTYGSFVDDRVLNALKEKGIEEVYIMGIQTENCVLTFARDAFDRGFRVFVMKDYCGSDASTESHKAALKIIEDNIGEII